MPDHDVRRSFTSFREGEVQILGDSLARLRTGAGIAPHHTRAAVGTRASGFCDRVMDARPAERAAHVQTILEHDGRRAGATTVDLDAAATNVDELSRHGKILRRPPPARRFVTGTNQHDQHNHAHDPNTAASNPFHGFASVPDQLTPYVGAWIE